MELEPNETSPTEPAKAICPACMQETELHVPFCSRCGMPIGKSPTLDPIQPDYMTGWSNPEAISLCPKPIVLLGRLLIYGPIILYMLFGIAVLVHPLHSADTGGDRLLALAFGLFCLVAYLAIVMYLIKGYLKSRLREYGRCINCGYQLTHLSESRCPECGKEFDPEDVPRSVEGTPIEDELSRPPKQEEFGTRAQRIACSQCEAQLPDDAETSRCAKCGSVFDRRERIFEIYGPEAFMDESEVEQPKASSSWAPVLRPLILFAVALLATAIVLYVVQTEYIRAGRVPYVIFLFVIVILSCFRASRDEKPSEPDNEADDGDSAGRQTRRSRGDQPPIPDVTTKTRRKQARWGASLPHQPDTQIVLLLCGRVALAARPPVRTRVSPEVRWQLTHRQWHPALPEIPG